MIHVLKGYRGRLTNEQFIPPGVYPENDEHLFGLAAYLVANGHAVETIAGIAPAELAKEPEPQAVRFLTEKLVGEVDKTLHSDEGQPTETKPGIEDLTLDELKKEATKRGLQFNSRSKKPELIALIEGSKAEVSDDEAT